MLPHYCTIGFLYSSTRVAGLSRVKPHMYALRTYFCIPHCITICCVQFVVCLVRTEMAFVLIDRYFTNHSHRAGTDASYVQAQFIEKEWKASGFDSVETKRYEVLVSYPKRPSVVSLINSNGSVAQSWLSVERSLEATVVFPYSAYSGSGTAVVSDNLASLSEASATTTATATRTSQKQSV